MISDAKDKVEASEDPGVRQGVISFDAYKLESVVGPQPDAGELQSVIAHHEAGHAVCAWFLPAHAAPTKVSIVPSGNLLACTEYSGADNGWSSLDIGDRMSVALGGMAAEDLFFRRITQGNQRDWNSALLPPFALSTIMVPNAEFKFDEKEIPQFLSKLILPIVFGSDFNVKVENSPVQFNDDSLQSVLVVGMICQSYGTALGILREHKDAVEKIAEILFEKQTVGPRDLRKILGKRPTASPRSVAKGKVGARFESLRLSDKQLFSAAFHKAGHVVACWHLHEDSIPVEVSLGSPTWRGYEGGRVKLASINVQLDEERRLYDAMCTALGGLAAEYLFHNTASTISSADIISIAHRAYHHVFTSECSGGTMKTEDYIEKLAMPFTQARQPMDEKGAYGGIVLSLICRAYGRALEVIESHRDAVEQIANILRKQGKLNEAEIRQVMGDRPFSNQPSDRVYGNCPENDLFELD